MNRRECALGIAACAGLAMALWLAPKAAAQPDSPIIVGDGSIVLQNRGGNLATWTVVNPSTLAHPDASKTMAVVEVTGPGAKNDTCAGRNRCVVEVRWSSGHTIRVVANQNGSKAMRLVSSGLTFNDPGWTKGAPVWRFRLPGGATPTVTISDAGGAATTICQGAGCQVIVHYQ